MPAVKCRDLYPDLVDPESASYSPSTAFEFDGYEICPNTTTIELYGDPFAA